MSAGTRQTTVVGAGGFQHGRDAERPSRGELERENERLRRENERLREKIDEQAEQILEKIARAESFFVDEPRSLIQLVRASHLIVVGTVTNVLPAFNVNPKLLDAIETHSLVTVKELLYGSLPSGISTILLAQRGGKAGPCALVVPPDPLVQNGEEYVLFVTADHRPIPNNTGAPRYSAVGIWSGKAKVTDGKIQFLPNAGPRIHEYDNTDAADFIATVEDMIKFVCRWHDVSFPCPPPKK